MISKIFESFVNGRIIKGTGLFSDLQHGFRYFRSTADFLMVYNSLDVGNEARAIALDILKAFEKFWHVGLLHKLKTFSVRGSIISIVESLLQDPSIKVVLDGQSFTPHDINAGVPQGFWKFLKCLEIKVI